MRRQGVSIKDIATQVGVSPATVSIWCQDILLTRAQKEKLFKKQIAAGHKGRMIGALKNKQMRLQNVANQAVIAQRRLGGLSARDRFLLGIGLYWGEGTKSRQSATAIVNSDPDIVLFARDWFENLGVNRCDFRVYVSISSLHKEREIAIVNFWSRTLAIPRQQFNRVTYFKTARKKVYENHDSYYGIVALRVRRGTDLKYMILGLIDACKVLPG